MNFACLPSRLLGGLVFIATSQLRITGETVVEKIQAFAAISSA